MLEVFDTKMRMFRLQSQLSREIILFSCILIIKILYHYFYDDGINLQLALLIMFHFFAIIEFNSLALFFRQCLMFLCIATTMMMMIVIAF
jgi:hypothetical protein